MVTEGVADFLSRVPPFQFLSPPERTALVPNLSLEYFPKGKRILGAAGPAGDALYVIEKGGVKLAVSTADGEEVVLDVRGEGEVFGLLSTLGGDFARLDVTALEDTLCYTLPSAQVQELLRGNREVADYLLHMAVARYIDRSLDEIRARTRLAGDGERLLYSLHVGEVLAKPLIVCGAKASIRQAARIMSEAAATYVVVLDEEGCAAGIITDRDLTQKVVAHGLPVDTPAPQVMSGPVIAIETSESLFQALLLMLGHNIHHLLVTRDGDPVGMLTNHDLLLLQGRSPLSLARHVERQETPAQLAEAHRQVNSLIPLLLQEGARAGHITRVIAEINDRTIAKVLHLAEEALGPPPLPYSWVVLGSEGRREQTFKTDQDNGLIYADPAGDEHARAAAGYFQAFAGWVGNALATLGYPPCPGGYMATTPRWCQPLRIWETYFSVWIGEPDRRRVLDALIFFDMRLAGGDAALFESLAQHFRHLLADASRFKSILAYLSIMHRPPRGFLRTFIVERSGEHKNELDLKLFGTGPIVNAARLLALDAGVQATNTLDRLAALEALGYRDRALLHDLAESWDFLMLLRLQRQLAQIEDQAPTGNYINPTMLTNLQRSLLKEAFQASARAQAQIEADFKSGIWAHLG
ncbi:MAG TPA: DUF294 nucleotidyltransferase-like domain-containing protein [Anaerolineae bacterium]